MSVLSVLIARAERRSGSRADQQAAVDLARSQTAWENLYETWEEADIVYDGDEAQAETTLELAAMKIDEILNDEDDLPAGVMVPTIFSAPDKKTRRGAIRMLFTDLVATYIVEHNQHGQKAADKVAVTWLLPALTALAWLAEKND